MESMPTFLPEPMEHEPREYSLETYSSDIVHYTQSETPNEDLAQSIATRFNLSIDEESFWDDDSGTIEDLKKRIHTYTEVLVATYKNGGFTQKSRIIDLMALMHSKARFVSNNSVAGVIRDITQAFLNSENTEQGNYFLSLFLQNTLEGETGDITEKVVPISPDQYLLRTEQGYCISKKEDHELVTATYEEWKNGQVHANTSVPDEVSRVSLEKTRDALELLEALFPIPLSEVNERFQKGRKNNLATSLSDIAFFTNKHVEATIHNAIGFSLYELSLQEQFYFVEYLKEVSNADAAAVFSFAKTYGVGGVRTFLSLEHGGRDIGNTILRLGEKLHQEDAEKIFTGYANIVDSAQSLQNRLEIIFDPNQQQGFETLPFQVADALLLRAKDILVGALRVTEKESTKTLNVPDVLSAIEGVTLVVGMLADLQQQKKFSFEKQKQSQESLFKFDVTDKDGYLYGLKFFIRPKAEKGAQARVNIELSFDTANPNEKLQKAFTNEIVSHTQHKTTKGSVLRIGLDREDHGGNEAVSLDIGRSEHTDDAFSRTGDVLGNLLALASAEGNHTTTPFDASFATEENFEKLALMLQEYLVKLSGPLSQVE